MSWLDDIGSLAGLVSIGTVGALTVKALTINVTINNNSSRPLHANSSPYYNSSDSWFINSVISVILVTYPVIGNQINKALFVISLCAPIISLIGAAVEIRRNGFRAIPSAVSLIVCSVLVAWIAHCASPYLPETAYRSSFVWGKLLDLREKASSTFVPGSFFSYFDGLAPDLGFIVEVAIKMMGLTLLFAGALRVGLSWFVSLKASSGKWVPLAVVGYFFACGNLATDNQRLWELAVRVAGPVWDFVTGLDTLSRMG